MCANQRCFNVTCGVNSSGFVSVNIQSNGLDDASYFYVRLVGSEGTVLATIVSDQDETLKKLDAMKVTTAGTYNVSVKLIYDSKSSAYGFDKPQRKELNRVLCNRNSTCYMSVDVVVNHDVLASHRNSHFGWRPFRSDDKILTNDNTIQIRDNGQQFYFHEAANKLFFIRDNPRTEELRKCMREKKFAIIGDSHEEMIAKVLNNKYSTSNGWRMFFHGTGVYHNVSPDNDFKAYVTGKLPAVFVPGKMLENLKTGEYKKLQAKENYDGWIFSSGHWDLRDVSLEEYMKHLEELFQKWDDFRRDTKVNLFWNGIPSYSYKRDSWGGMERRTNIKIGLADHFTKFLCQKFNVSFVPFFDLSFPFYSKSCDTHHYLCPKRPSPIGEAQLTILLQTICNS